MFANICCDSDVILFLSAVVTTAMLEPWRYTIEQQFNILNLRMLQRVVCCTSRNANYPAARFTKSRKCYLGAT